MATVVWTLNPFTEPCGWWVLLGPLTITILVRFVSGVPILEKKLKTRDGFEEYAKRTNIFFPLPPKGSQ